MKNFLQAVIFDVDGVLIDSEPFWREAEMESFGRCGLHLSEADCILTAGRRIQEVTRFWYAARPWQGPSPEELADQIMEGVIDRINRRGSAMDGVFDAIRFFRERGFRLALASSSAMTLIDAVLEKLGLQQTFEVVCSAENEPSGKPHPGVYLTTAARLGLPPERCVAVEDSINGVIAAKAAGMKCLAVPLPQLREDSRYSQADAILRSLTDMNPLVLKRLQNTNGTAIDAPRV